MLIKPKTPPDRFQQVSWLEAMFITDSCKQECFIMSISQDGQGPQSKDGMCLFGLGTTQKSFDYLISDLLLNLIGK